MKAYPGSTKTEYAIIIGLVAVLGIGAATGLGGAISKLFQGKELSGGQNNSGAYNMTLLNFNGPPGAAGDSAKAPKGTGYYQVTLGPDGRPQMVLMNGNGANSNATSVDGNQWNALGTVMLGKSMMELAAAQTDPDMRAYLQQLADKMFYLSGAESELDDIPHLSIEPSDKGRNHNRNYSKGNALEDVYALKNEIRDLLNDPRMQQLSPQDQILATAYGADAYNIGQDYVNALHQFIDQNGNVPRNFGDMSDCNSLGCSAGNTQPGSVMAKAGKLSTAYDNMVPMVEVRYEQYFSPREVRQKAMQVLQSNLGTTEVTVTITDARLSDQLQRI